MLKRYQKRKKYIFIAKCIFFWGGGRKNKEKCQKNDFLVLILSICGIFPKLYYHFYFKEDSKMKSEETNINSTILGLKEWAGRGKGHSS